MRPERCFSSRAVEATDNEARYGKGAIAADSLSLMETLAVMCTALERELQLLQVPLAAN